MLPVCSCIRGLHNQQVGDLLDISSFAAVGARMQGKARQGKAIPVHLIEALCISWPTPQRAGEQSEQGTHDRWGTASCPGRKPAVRAADLAHGKGLPTAAEVPPSWFVAAAAFTPAGKVDAAAALRARPAASAGATPGRGCDAVTAPAAGCAYGM